jgi:hypothetical protein
MSPARPGHEGRGIGSPGIGRVDPSGRLLTDAERGARYRARHPDRVAEKMRRRYEKHRVLVDALKSAPCMDCGNLFPPVCMDFDHVRGNKRQNVSLMVPYAPEALFDEIAKCDVVCSNCHRIRTQRRRSLQPL